MTKHHKTHHSSNKEEGKTCAFLAYLLVGIIWFFAEDKMRKDKFAAFHVKQGLVLLIAAVLFSIIYSVIFGIFSMILIFIPFVGWALISLLGLVYLVPAIWAVIGIINALNGKKKELPLIGQFGKHFTF